MNFCYRVRTLLLRIYYEFYNQNEENYDFLLDYISSLDKQLKRDKSLEKNKLSAFVNFTKFTKKIIKARFENEEKLKIVNLIGRSIELDENVFAKDWLLEKIRELRTAP